MIGRFIFSKKKYILKCRTMFPEKSVWEYSAVLKNRMYAEMELVRKTTFQCVVREMQDDWKF